MDSMKRHFTATGLIIKNDSVLPHLHPKINLWLPPGGHVELNEDPIETVKREIFEETGYKVQIIMLWFGLINLTTLQMPKCIMKLLVLKFGNKQMEK